MGCESPRDIPEELPATDEEIIKNLLGDKSVLNLPSGFGGDYNEKLKDYLCDKIDNPKYPFAKILWGKITNPKSYSEYLPLPKEKHDTAFFKGIFSRKEVPEKSIVLNKKAERLDQLCGKYGLNISDVQKAIKDSKNELQLVHNLAKNVFKIPPEVLFLGVHESTWNPDSHNFYAEKGNGVVVSDIGLWQLNMDTAHDELGLNVTDVEGLIEERNGIIRQILELINQKQTAHVQKKLEKLRGQREDLKEQIRQKIVSDTTDERKDTVFSTIAALHHLKNLYKKTYGWDGNKEAPKDYKDNRRWFFALLAYNRGEGAVRGKYISTKGNPEKYAEETFIELIKKDKKGEYSKIIAELNKEKSKSKKNIQKIKKLEKDKTNLEKKLKDDPAIKKKRALAYVPDIFAIKEALKKHLKEIGELALSKKDVSNMSVASRGDVSGSLSDDILPGESRNVS